MRFRYKYEHLDCACCLALSQAASCPHNTCPHIMEHLGELVYDPAFHTAIETADRCKTFHRATLLQLQQNGISRPAWMKKCS